MTPDVFHSQVVWGVIALAPVVFVALFFLQAGYGRHREGGFLPDVPARVAWVLMESPTIVVFLPVYAMGDHAAEPIPLLLMAVFQVHYWNRTVVYPLRIRPGAAGAAWWVVALAFVYQTVNSWLIARWISHLGDYSGWSLVDPRLVIGLTVMGGGAALNLHSDGVLRRLRAPGETGYRVPHGGGYRWVTAPNYLGELIEWTGYAVATWSLAGVSFAVFTAANLVPRAWANHRWYREKFPDYPAERRAILPYLF